MLRLQPQAGGHVFHVLSSIVQHFTEMSLGAELVYVSLCFFMTYANQDNLVQVLGLLNQSIKLPSNMSFQSPVQEINWNFAGKGKSYKIAQFENPEPKFYNTPFNGRLKLLHNGTTLQIKNLTMEDSGQYTAQFILTMEQDNYFVLFMLMVYEPVSDPSIRIIQEERTSHSCNVSLHCSVSTNSTPLTYTWIYRYNGSVYNESGDAIHLLLNYSSNEEFHCIVGNPADKKNVSKQARCDAADGSTLKRASLVIIINIIITSLLLILLILVILKLRRKGSSKLTTDDDQAQIRTNDREQHHLSVEAEEHGGEQTQEETDMVYCEPTSPTTQTISWHKRDNHVTPPPQNFKTLYTSFKGNK